MYFHELESTEPQVIFEDEKVSVTTIPLDHRVYTNGFLFAEKLGERTLNIDVARERGVDLSYYSKIKQGFDAPDSNDNLVANKDITFDPMPPKSYAYCSDTAYYPEIIPQIKNATALYHESTFLDLHHDLAEKTKHSTAKEAAVIAKKAEVGTLILGHYSGRYGNLDAFKTEAQEIFEHVKLAQDGKVIEI